MAAHNKSKNTFDFLQKNTHRVNEAYAYQLPLTPNPHPYKNDSQYWLFSDLYNLFGGQYVGRHKDIDNTMQTAITFSDFEKLPRTNADKISRPNSFIDFYSGHVVTIANDYNIHEASGTTITRKNGPDAKLSRYACWAMMKRWPSRIFAQLYFIMPDTTFEDLYNAAYKFSRIYQRAELSRAEKIINGIAYRHNANMRQVHAKMDRAFFYISDTDTIRDAYEISGSLLDYMGARSLMARRIALDNAIQKFDSAHRVTFDTFMDILYEELIRARINMSRQTDRTPEADISRTPISRVASDLKKLERQFINKYAFQNLR